MDVVTGRRSLKGGERASRFWLGPCEEFSSARVGECAPLVMGELLVLSLGEEKVLLLSLSFPLSLSAFSLCPSSLVCYERERKRERERERRGGRDDTHNIIVMTYQTYHRTKKINNFT